MTLRIVRSFVVHVAREDWEGEPVGATVDSLKGAIERELRPDEVLVVWVPPPSQGEP